MLAAATDRAVLLFDVVQVVLIIFSNQTQHSQNTSFIQNRTGPVVAVRTSERKVGKDKNMVGIGIGRQTLAFLQLISHYKSFSFFLRFQVKVPLGALAFPATDGSRLAAGDK